VRVSNRSLALVVALTGADFLLWTVALGANNAMLAVIAGLTLPPLVAACTLALVLAAARLLSRIKASAIPAVPRQTAARRRPGAARLAPRYVQTEPTTPGIRSARTRGSNHAPDHDGVPATAAGGRTPTPARKLAA
jgi:hypothetical protein